MKALLLKDLFTMKKQLYWIIFIIIFFIFLTFFFGDGMLLLTLGFVFGTVQISSLFTFDEMSRWDQFANTLPLKREIIVLSKYVISCLITLGIMAVIAPIILIQNSIAEEKIPAESLPAMFCFIISASILLNSPESVTKHLYNGRKPLIR